MRVGIAGATGFVGSALSEALRKAGHEVVALSRRGGEGRVACDLYDAADVERGLAGCEVAVYLVHSMMPSARLTQATFEDLDLILADNFARAAAHNGVRQIIYLGGLVPPGDRLSAHLHSRLEVEQTLGSHGVPVTALRAGLVVGPGGSSLRIMVNLVRRLPAMLTPRWTRNPTHPIALTDVVRAILECVGNERYFDDHFDVGGPDVMSYRQMLERTAKALGLRRAMIAVPFFSTGLSKLWVSLVSSTPMELVGPLVDSLRHETVGHDNPLQRVIGPDAASFEDSLRDAARDWGESDNAQLVRRRRKLRAGRSVRSVQRLPHPDKSAAWVGEEYVRWLPSVPVPGLTCEIRGDEAHFRLRWTRRALLILRRESGGSLGDDFASFEVVGGALADTSEGSVGRLEFRSILGGRHIIAAVHDFRPRLPWLIYSSTQAIAHLFVMRAFGRHLGRLAADPRLNARPAQPR